MRSDLEEVMRSAYDKSAEKRRSSPNMKSPGSPVAPTCATYLLRQGMTVDEVADFLTTTPQVIRRVYGHLIPGQHSKASDTFDTPKVGQKRSKNAATNLARGNAAVAVAVSNDLEVEADSPKPRLALRVVGGTDHT